MRNAASEGTAGVGRCAEHASLLTANLAYLDEMYATNPGVRRPTGIIRKLIAANNIHLGVGAFLTPFLRFFNPPVRRTGERKEINYGYSLHSDQPVSSGQSASVFDLELIFGTFPGGTDFLRHGHGHAHAQGQDPSQGQSQEQGANNMPLDIDCILDPLFGFMGAPFMLTPPGNLGVADAGEIVGEGNEDGDGDGNGCII